MKHPFHLLLACLPLFSAGAQAQTGSIALPWSGHGHDAQHTGLSPVTSKPLGRILWQVPVGTSRRSTAARPCWRITDRR